jgi:hypothetical protein
MEQIDITTRFSKEGKLIPLEFTLGEDRIAILNIGRQWETKEGKHILVMDPQQNTYHLFFSLADMSWYLISDSQGSPGKV